MPEGDTVFLAATRLRRAIGGQRLLRTDLRMPREATTDLAGQTVTEIVPRGKHLLFRTDAGWTLHTHFRLDGIWTLFRPAERWARGDDDHQVRAVLVTEPWIAVGFRLATCEVLRTADEHTVVGHLGPDPLGPDWDLAEALRRMRAHPDREIGDVLLDQTVVAGWGNAYKNEIMFLRGLDPWMKVRDVADLEGVVTLGRRLLLANRTTGRWVTTGNLRPHEGQYVMERAGKPCRRCGTTIRRTRQDGDGYPRWTYWCPTCQPSAHEGGTIEPIRTPRRV